MSNSPQNHLPSEHIFVEQLDQKEEKGNNGNHGLCQEQIHIGNNFENDEELNIEGGGETVIFQQVESLDRLFVEGREKPPKFINGRYLISTQLGQGSYGKVKEILDTYTLQRKAVKIMNKQKLKKIPNGEQNALKEFQLMKKLSHKNVLTVYDLLRREQEEVLLDDEDTLEEEGFTSNFTGASSSVGGTHVLSRTGGGQRSMTKPEKLYLIMQYCICGLYDLLQNAPDGKLPSWQAHRYFCDLVEGIEYLHSRRIIHKDIKPQNLLIAPDESVKIADFGVAEELDFFTDDSTLKSSAGTPMFQSPEVSAGKSSFCGFKLDVWSAGITLFNMTTGTYPFSGANIYLLLENISTQTVTIPSDLAPQLQTLLEGMLEKNPIHRFSISQVKGHRWVTQKHCVTPEKVPLPSSVAEREHVTSWPPRDPYSYQQQFRANSSTSAAATAHSIAFYDSDIVNSLEKIFNITDSDTGMSKVEANDVMHCAGGGNGTGVSVGATAATGDFYSKQNSSQSNTASNSNEHANNNSAPVSSSYHQFHSQSHTVAQKNKTEALVQPGGHQQQSSLDRNSNKHSPLPSSRPQTTTNGVSAPQEDNPNVETEVVKSTDVTDPSSQSKSRTSATKQKKKCEVM